MPRCLLCNNLEVSRGETYLFATWLATIESSPCRFCQVLIKAARQVDPDYISQTHDEASLFTRIFEKGQVAIHWQCNGWGSLACRFELFRSMHEDTVEGRPVLINVPTRNEIAPVPGHTDMWNFLRSSLRTCLEEHQACKKQQDLDPLPDRLLEIGPGSEGHPDIRLIDTRHQRPSSAYFALSHCWGPQSFLCTTSQTIQAHRNVIRYLDLPRTFQDAVTVALEMKAMYLWIDSLCIIQDQEDDWARHAEKMDKIYDNAIFVAAAVSSSASFVPFLGTDAPTDRYLYRAVDIELATTEDGQNRDLAPIIKARKQSPELSPGWVTGPLEERAWAFQERYCAVRIVSFTALEVKWQCETSVGCECLGGLKDQDHKPGSSGDDTLAASREWREVCAKYSSRDLTYNSDRLSALAGIASRFHHRLRSNYIAGLWELELPFNLGWYRRELTDSPIHSYPIFPSMSNGVPTWSWASNFGTPL